MKMRKDDDVPLLPDSRVSSLDAMVVFGLMRTHAYISPFIDGSLRDLKVSGPQFNVLLLLHAERDGLPLSGIGRRLVVTKPNVTGLIDRLEQKGLAERRKSSDRRVTVARLTRKGIRLVDRILPRHEALLTQLMDCLSRSEKRRLAALLTKLRRGLRHQCCR